MSLPRCLSLISRINRAYLAVSTYSTAVSYFYTSLSSTPSTSPVMSQHAQTVQRHDSVSESAPNVRLCEVILECVFDSRSTLYRAPSILDACNHSGLLWGIDVIEQRIWQLINLEVEMRITCLKLLSNEQYAEVARRFPVPLWEPRGRHMLVQCDKDSLLDHITSALEMHDDIAKSIRRWKLEVDQVIGR